MQTTTLAGSGPTFNRRDQRSFSTLTPPVAAADSYPSQPVFWADFAGSGEDAGVLLSVVLDPTSEGYYPLVLHAETIRVRAWCAVPHHIPSAHEAGGAAGCRAGSGTERTPVEGTPTRLPGSPRNSVTPVFVVNGGERRRAPGPARYRSLRMSILALSRSGSHPGGRRFEPSQLRSSVLLSSWAERSRDGRGVGKPFGRNGWDQAG